MGNELPKSYCGFDHTFLPSIRFTSLQFVHDAKDDCGLHLVVLSELLADGRDALNTLVHQRPPHEYF